MTEDDINFEQLVDLLDRALTSKDPKVMRALKKFLFIAALATEDTEAEGPFRNIMRRIEALEAKSQMGTYTWPSYPPGQIWYNSGGTGGGTTTSSTTAYYKYIPDTNTAGTTFDSDDFYKSFPTVTCSTASSDIIDSELNDLEQMAKDSLAKSK